MLLSMLVAFFIVYRKPRVRRGVPESLSDKEMVIKIPPLIK